MTSEMRRIAQGIAKRHHTYVYGVCLLAAVAGPSGWRGCVSVSHDYKPRYGKIGTRPLPDRPQRPKRLRYLDEDAFSFL